MRRGFTLIEVLIAIGLLVVLSVAMGTFAFNLLQTRDRLMAQSAAEAGVGLLLDRLEHDLTWCIAGNADDGAGVKGTSTGIEILRRDVRLLDGQVAVGVARKAHYHHEGGAVLAHAADGDDETVALGVERLRLRYHDGQAWLDEFDSSEAGTLPVAVEVSVWFDPHEGGTDRNDGGAEDETIPSEELMPAEFDITPSEPDRRRIVVIPDGPTAGWASVGAGVGGSP
jgi:prepilin-type N-terminal cleavage/methylation domain-containing protein